MRQVTDQCERCEKAVENIELSQATVDLDLNKDDCDLMTINKHRMFIKHSSTYE